MSQKISLKTIQAVLNALYVLNLSQRETAHRYGVSRDMVRKYYQLYQESGLPYPPKREEDWAAVFAQKPAATAPARLKIDFDEVHDTLQKCKNATIRQVYEEWVRQLGPDEAIIGYSQFAKRYSCYKKSLQISMRHHHTPGECVFVDYAGSTVPIINQKTGEITQAQIFVGVLGYSGYTFCEATASQSSQDWNASHIRMFEFFKGVPQFVVPDNLKAAVIKADKYFAQINQNYSKLCEHYGVEPFPARVRKPKDKAKAEAGVLLVQRWILFRLRKQQFFSLNELNRAIVPLLEQLNRKPFQKQQGSRYSRFMETEWQCLKPLPAQAYANPFWGQAYAGLDYHVLIDGTYYSVPFHLKSKQVEFCLKQDSVSLYHEQKLVAAHLKGVAGAVVTHPDHLAPTHRAVAAINADTVLQWAANYGAQTGKYFTAFFERYANRSLHYRFFKGFKKMVGMRPAAEVEYLCSLALEKQVFDSRKLKQLWLGVQKKLPTGRLSSLQHVQTAAPEVLNRHDNLRGADYYRRQSDDTDPKEAATNE